MAQPPAYNRTKDFSADYGDQTDNQAINNELDAVATSINAIRGNLAKIQRDDGGLRDGIVTKDALDPELKDELYAEFSGNINDSVLEAQQAAVEATNAAASASADAQAAATGAAQASASATTAQASASAASASQAAAFSSAQSASGSAASAGGFATAAAESATAANSAATTAAAAAATATDRANAAETSAASAQGSAADAGSSSSAAASSAVAAAGSRDLAQSWASKTDGPVADGEFSAKHYALITGAAAKWGTRGIAELVHIEDHLVGAETPPTDSSDFRYIKLTASDSYNTGVLTGESVSGSAPTVTATAIISLAGSPLNGQTVQLINTERRFLRAGAPGTLEDSQNAAHTHSGPGAFVGNSATSSTPGQSTTGLVRNTTDGVNTGIGSSGGAEARSRNMGVTVYMRIL